MAKKRVMTLQVLVSKMVIKTKIYEAYQAHSAAMVALKRYKRANGYCGGSPSCLEYVGQETALCDHCRDAKVNRLYVRPTYEYGEIRAKERVQERKAAKKKQKPAEKRAA